MAALKELKMLIWNLIKQLKGILFYMKPSWLMLAKLLSRHDERHHRLNNSTLDHQEAY